MTRRMNPSALGLLFLLISSLARHGVRGYGPDSSDESTSVEAADKSGLRPNDVELINRMEEQMLKLKKSGDPARDKRALGILLQGFMEALGYTVSPVQYTSIPNAGQMPGNASSVRPMAMMMPMPSGASATVPPRQRETVRITGVLNFGDSRNTSNLVNHLQQYEQLFHGNRSASPGGSAPPAAPAPSSDIDPRARPLLPEPYFVKIPLPIAPNLAGAGMPSSKPINDTYRDEFSSKEHSEEFSNSQDDSSERDDDVEEVDKSHYSEEYDRKRERYHDNDRENNDDDDNDEKDDENGPEDRNYESEVGSARTHEPREKNVETEYKNNKNIENYRVENRVIHHPSEISEEVPDQGSKFNHAMFVDEPDWKQKQEARIYKLAAEQEARAEALAEENASRERAGTSEADDDEEYHRSREKEIRDKNEGRSLEYRGEESNEEEEEAEAGRYGDRDDGEGDRDEASNSSGTPVATDSQRGGARTVEPTGASNDYEDETTRNNYDRSTLPLSRDPEKLRQDQALRDSYGEILEKPDGKVDERVAGYFTMFKNPQTGVYDPRRIERYENARINFDHGDLIDGFNRIQKEYRSPEDKYEEYEINNDERVEHRALLDIPRLKSAPGASADRTSGEASSRSTGCNCDKRQEAQRQEATSPQDALPPFALPPQQIDYGAYRPTVTYLGDPLNYDQSIITRLTTYEEPSATTRLQDRADVVRDRNRTKTEKQGTVGSTNVAVPERSTTTAAAAWLHEAEAKEIRAWPSPFDETDGYGAHRNVIFKKSAKPICDGGAAASVPVEHAREVDRLLKVRQDELNEETGRRDSRRRADSNKRPVTAIGYRAQPTTKQIVRSEGRTRARSNPRRVTSTTQRSSKNPQDYRRTDHPEGQRLVVGKMELGDRLPRGEAPSNYIEKNGILYVPDPTPYYYNERKDDFVETPDSESERVKIKEYRNRVASLRVSQLKQLHPEGSMQIFKYTRQIR